MIVLSRKEMVFAECIGGALQIMCGLCKTVIMAFTLSVFSMVIYGMVLFIPFYDRRVAEYVQPVPMSLQIIIFTTPTTVILGGLLGVAIIK